MTGGFLGDNTSAVVTVNPWNMSGVPEFKFLGPEGSVEGFRQKLAGNVKDWDCNGNLSDEILRLLGDYDTFNKQCCLVISRFKLFSLCRFVTIKVLILETDFWNNFACG